MQTISSASMEAAIAFLFNRIVRGDRYASGDLQRYAAIGSFLTNEAAFLEAMRGVAGDMLEFLNTYPERFEISINGSLYVRQKSLNEERARSEYRNLALSEIERERGQKAATIYKEPDPNKKQLYSNFQKEGRPQHNQDLRSEIDVRMNSIRERERTFLEKNPGLFRESSSGFPVRRFHFHRLLREMEAKFGFVDKGRILMGDLMDGFGDMLRSGEVWKDSIAATHGEYTHRLQWLAVAQHFRVGRDGLDAFMPADITRLYKGCANAMRKKYQEYYKADKNSGLTIATSLWNFLFDAVPKSFDAPGIWDGATRSVDLTGDRTVDILKEDEVLFLAMLRQSGRTDSFRSPTNVTSMLRTDATMGLLHAYITGSQLKTKIMDNGRIQGGSSYRRDRLADKYKFKDTAAVSFEPPTSPAIDVGKTI